MTERYAEQSDNEPAVSYPADPSTFLPERLAQLRMTPAQYLAMRAERVERERAAPKIGDPALDFMLERLGPDGARTDQTLTLSNQKGRPVGLIFGSYT